VRAGERRSDAESELASDDPMDLDDMVFSDEEESQEVVVTSVVRRGPTAAAVGEEQGAMRRVEVPALRQHAASVNTIGERAVKRTRSPPPSVVPPVPLLPAPDAAERSGRSEEQSGAGMVAGLVPMPDM